MEGELHVAIPASCTLGFSWVIKFMSFGSYRTFCHTNSSFVISYIFVLPLPFPSPLFMNNKQSRALLVIFSTHPLCNTKPCSSITQTHTKFPHLQFRNCYSGLCSCSSRKTSARQRPLSKSGNCSSTINSITCTHH